MSNKDLKIYGSIPDDLAKKIRKRGTKALEEEIRKYKNKVRKKQQ